MVILCDLSEKLPPDHPTHKHLGEFNDYQFETMATYGYCYCMFCRRHRRTIWDFYSLFPSEDTLFLNDCQHLEERSAAITFRSVHATGMQNDRMFFIRENLVILMAAYSNSLGSLVGS